MNRTDVHSPKSLITEDYEFVACGRFPTAENRGYSPLLHEASHLPEEGWKFGDSDHENSVQCYHCGAHLVYYAILKHHPSHTLVRVGETCLDNRFDRSSVEFHKLRKQAQLDREQQRVKKALATWIQNHKDDHEYLIEFHQGNQFYESLWSYLNRNGELSERQLEALRKGIKKDIQREEERNQDEISPVIEGRIEITGKVLSLRTVDSYYGPSLKMLVLDDRGFKIWGTCPSHIEGFEGDGKLRDRRISLTATVTKSNDDECFGFFKRPSKAKIID